MFTVRENTTIVGVSELRSQWRKIQQILHKHGRVEVALRNKTEAVLLLKAQVEEMENLFDRLEDYALAIEAHQRDQKARSEDYIPLSDVLKKFL